jgi:hypothetical protein
MTAHPTAIVELPANADTVALRADIAALRTDIANLCALIRQVPVAPPQARQCLTIEEASGTALRSPQTIRAWCRGPYRIGTRVKNRWQVDGAQLRRLLIDRFGEARLPHGLR